MEKKTWRVSESLRKTGLRRPSNSHRHSLFFCQQELSPLNSRYLTIAIRACRRIVDTISMSIHIFSGSPSSLVDKETEVCHGNLGFLFLPRLHFLCSLTQLTLCKLGCAFSVKKKMFRIFDKTGQNKEKLHKSSKHGFPTWLADLSSIKHFFQSTDNYKKFATWLVMQTTFVSHETR